MIERAFAVGGAVARVKYSARNRPGATWLPISRTTLGACFSSSSVITAAKVAISTAGSATADGRSDRSGLQGRKIALDIDDQLMPALGIENIRRLADAIRARGVAFARHDRATAGSLDRGADIGRIVSQRRPDRSRAAIARRQTRTIMGSPWISASGLPGRRVAIMRAGIRISGSDMVLMARRQGEASKGLKAERAYTSYTAARKAAKRTA